MLIDVPEVREKDLGSSLWQPMNM